jgi:hypothetical protein
VSIQKDSAPTNSPSGSNTDMASVKVAMLPMTFQSWSRHAFGVKLFCLTLSLMTDTVLPSQLSSLVVQKNDLDHTSNSREMPPQPPSALRSSLTASTTRRDTDTNNHKISIISIVVLPIVKQLPSSQEKLGDAKLDQARELRNEIKSMIPDNLNDLRIIEDKIAL